jgi:predicted naringenin-chalcone synthase
MTEVCITRIATATPPNDVHSTFLEYASGMLEDQRSRAMLNYLARRSGIDHRYSYILAPDTSTGLLDGDAVFRMENFPTTGKRMELFEHFAPQLLYCALDRLALSEEERRRIGHVIVTCCTGLYAPGLDFAAIQHLQLNPETDRTMVGFMGCYAAINGLKLARHIVRSQPDASVLMVNLELCSLHLQETRKLEEMLSFLLFGDGCAATLIQAGDSGLALDGFRAITIPQTRDLIEWRIGDLGFDMDLSTKVPGELRKALRDCPTQVDPDGNNELWAVHPGGRAILDAVGDGLGLAPEKLSASRSILQSFGNMSSATVMFVLQELMRTAQPGQYGCAMSFGPGITAETMQFHVC